MSSEPTVVVGRITRPHGVRGEVVVQVLSEVPGRFDPGARVWLEDGRPLTVAAARPHRDRLLVSFVGVPDRAAVEALRGAFVVVPATASPPLPEGSWWDHQVLGCAVRTDTGRELGTVRDVIHTTANDVWSVVADDGTETLVPALRDVLVEVDVDARQVLVRAIEGLTVPEDTPPSAPLR